MGEIRALLREDETLMKSGVVEWSDEDQSFVGSYPGIIGPCCHGDDKDQVFLQLRQIVDEWLEIEYEDREKSP